MIDPFFVIGKCIDFIKGDTLRYRLEGTENVGTLSRLLSKLDRLINNLHDKGFQFNSRLQGDIAIYEFCFGGFIGDILCHTAKSLKLDTVNYSTHTDSHISAQISIKSIFEKAGYNQW